LVNLRSIKDFILILNEILSKKNENQIKNSLDIREILSNALNEYLFSCSREEKNAITEGVYKKFEENKNIEKIKKDKILNKLISSKAINIKKLYFQKWKKTILQNSFCLTSKTNFQKDLIRRRCSKTE
jgi:hypothetical protein